MMTNFEFLNSLNEMQLASKMMDSRCKMCVFNDGLCAGQCVAGVTAWLKLEHKKKDTWDGLNAEMREWCNTHMSKGGQIPSFPIEVLDRAMALCKEEVDAVKEAFE